MPNKSVNQGGLSRAERFLLDDEKHLRRFSVFKEKQKRQMDDWNRLDMLVSSGQVNTAEFERLRANKEKLSETLDQLMAENDRLVAEENAIIHPGVFGSFARLFGKADKAELEAVAQIKRNASAREAKNRAAQ